MQGKIAHQVGAAVSNMRDCHTLAIEMGRNYRCAHSGIGRFGTRGFVQNAVHSLNCSMKHVASDILRGLSGKGLKQGINGEPAGHLACLASADAIADHEEPSIQIESECVLIRLSHLADIALR
jgi:hypothetical protein